MTNSTQGVFEERVAALEGGSAALAVASGAAAITYAIEALAANGGHIVAQKTIYGGSFNLLAHTLPQYGVTTTFVDIHDLDEVKAAIQDNTKAIFIETLGNPNSDIPDIEALAELAHSHSIPLVIDNTFGTPYLIRPIEQVPTSSSTPPPSSSAATARPSAVSSSSPASSTGKPRANIRRSPTRTRVITASPLPTQSDPQPLSRISVPSSCGIPAPPSLRLTRSCSFKAWRPCLSAWSGTRASIFTFDIKGGKEEAWAFIDNLSIFSLLANVADVKSLVIHPASTTHSQLTEEELNKKGFFKRH